MAGEPMNGGQIVQPRRSHSSLFTGLLLIFFGVLLLARHFVPGLPIGTFLARYWPVALILWGLSILLEQRAARREGRSFRSLSGGDFLLLMAMVMLVTSLIIWDQFRNRAAEWGISTDWMRESAISQEELPSAAVQPGDQIQISIPAGDISVHAGDDNMLHVVAKRMGYAWDKSTAQRTAQKIDIVIDRQSGGYIVKPGGWFPASPDARVDLDIEAPAESKIAAQTNHGDVSISGMKSGATVATRSGDTQLRDITGDVSVDSHSGDADISGVQGNISLTGAGGDVEIADITGDVTLRGEYEGPIRVRTISGLVQFTSSRTQLSIAQVTGHMEVDSDSLEITDAAGALKLATHDKDITVENIGGAIDVTNRHGNLDVKVTQASDAAIRLANDSGDITLTLPSHANFSIDANSRSGKIESDFQGPSLTLTNGDNQSHLEGSYGTGGAHIEIENSYGTISLHQAP